MILIRTKNCSSFSHTVNNYSGRSPAVVNPKKIKSEDEADDLTKDMPEPIPEPNVQEVVVPKPGQSKYILYYTFCINVLCVIVLYSY